MVCGLSTGRSRPGRGWSSSTRSRTVKAIVTDLHYRIDVNTLHRDETATQLRRSPRRHRRIAAAAQAVAGR